MPSAASALSCPANTGLVLDVVGHRDDDLKALSASVSRNRIDTPAHRPEKRGKTAGLNARFDRMIRSVNTMLSSPASSRKRMPSSGTSSVSSHDLPKTPLDAYMSLHLGKDFSVLKMKKPPVLPWGESDGFPSPAAPPKEPRGPLPDWLANTFSSLEQGHPLRGLLSPSRINSEFKSMSPPMELPGDSHEEEQLFAFSPFEFDRQEAAYLADSTLARWGNRSPREPSLSHLPSERSTVSNVLPFSTPGRFAPGREKMQRSIVDCGTCQEQWVPVPQQVTSLATDMMQRPTALPATHLRLDDDEIEWPRFTRTFSNLTRDNESPSDIQEHHTCIGHNHHLSPLGHDHLNVYATPGPTFVCSRPVYFDSPTEDPSLSDPLQPKSYELDLNAIGFRWRPFLRSNTQDGDANRRSASPSTPLGHAMPNQTCDQSGWNARFPVNQGECGASSEELPSLSEDVDIAYTGVMRPSNVNATRAVSNPIGPSPINDVQQARPRLTASLAPGVLLSPLRELPRMSALLAADGVPPRGDGENIQTSEEEFFLVSERRREPNMKPAHSRPVVNICRPTKLPGEEFTAGRAAESEEPEFHAPRPSTPIRQVPVSPPSTPQKARSSQLCGMPPAPVRKTSSALSWMMPFKFSKRTVAAQQDDVNYHLSRVSANSHDSIESWSEETSFF